jgi:hypothetical protein
MAFQARDRYQAAVKRGVAWAGAAARAVGAALVTGCAVAPPPDWALDAYASIDAAVQAQLKAQPRVAEQEFERARRALARTGRVDLVARAELLRCAAQVASLDFAPCSGFDALRADASAADLAYADYLYGEVATPDVELLPAHHRVVAMAHDADAKALAGIEDPLARLVAAAVLLRSGHARPEIIAPAVDTASAQGWRRPLLAWLHVQLRLAEQDRASDDAQRIQRRIDLVGGR